MPDGIHELSSPRPSTSSSVDDDSVPSKKGAPNHKSSCSVIDGQSSAICNTGMEYKRLSNNATKPRGLGMVRFFGKQRGKKDGRGRDGPPEAEARTDATTIKAPSKDSGARDGSAGQTAAKRLPPTKKNGVLKPLAPTSRGREKEAKSAALPPGGGGNFAPPKAKPPASKSPRQQSPKPDKRTATFASSPTKAPKALGPNAGKAPTSILHKPHYTLPAKAQPPPPPDNYGSASPLQVYPMAGNPRVRFMSAGESVASTVSQVHLMKGADSVASSSCMSSSGDPNHPNVFDRVLNMVMAEEHVRLNAMGMAHPHSVKQQEQHQQKAKTNDRMSKADAKAAVVAIPGLASGEDDLGLAPPKRGDLAPIDIDTGLEIGHSQAPIDADTGLELGEHLGEGTLSPIDTDTGMEIQLNGGETEYHDTNDDNIDSEKWKKLNDDALGRMKGLNMKDSRRSRSYDQRPTREGADGLKSHGSDPERFSRSDSDHGPPRGNDKSEKAPPPRKGTKAKTKFWGGKDLESEEWVAFDKRKKLPKGKAAPGRVSDLAAF